MATPTPTADLTDRPEPSPCGCAPFRLCPSCMGRLQRERHDAEIGRWLSTYGTRETRAERQRPALRVVR